MAKRTIKYVKALEVASQFNIADLDNQERLYRFLGEQNFFWNSDTQKWERDDQVADLPTDLIRVRVWTDSNKVRGVAYQVRSVLEKSGYQFIEQSEAYFCRPFKQLESRIYITFKQQT